MLDETTKGIFTIAATPFLPNGELDFHSLKNMVDVYIEKGATGLTILGMMGEADKLSSEEYPCWSSEFFSPDLVIS